MKTSNQFFNQSIYKNRIRMFCALFMLSIFGVQHLSAQITTTLTAVADADIWSEEPDENYGNCDELNVGRDDKETSRGLIRFDLGSLPANIIVTSATLRLRRDDGKGGGNRDISVHRVTAAWTEGSGNCSGSSTNDVTWSNRTTSTAWTSSGGDFNATAEATTSVGGDGDYDWDVTSLVSGWLAGTFNNNGFLLKYVSETEDEHYRQFVSRNDGKTGERPRLIVTYITCPNSISLTSTSAQNTTAGSASQVTLNNTTASNLPVGSYTVAYNLGAPNAAIGLTAAMTVSTAGTGTFNIPGTALQNSGTTSVTITGLKFSSCNNVTIISGNTSSIQVTCPSSINLTSVTDPEVYLSYDANVTLNASVAQMPIGSYFVTYNLGAPNAANGLIAGMTVSTAGTGVFTIPAMYLSSPDSTTITITDLSYGTCGKATLSSGNTFRFNVVDFNPACGFGPGKGCSNTNYNNSFMRSWNDATTIEYNNFLSTYHSSIVRTTDGSFLVWGERIANNGSSHILSPQKLDGTNYPALGSAEVHRAAGGSLGSSTGQWILLASDGLYAWGIEGRIIDDALTTSTTFQKITGISGANSFGLPSGVNPMDVKMMVASASSAGGTVIITTCDGNVYSISEVAQLRGNGASGNATTWYQVARDTSGNPALNGIIATRLSGDGAMALGADGSIWPGVWEHILVTTQVALHEPELQE